MLHALVSKPYHFCGNEHQSQPTDLNEDPFSDPEKWTNWIYEHPASFKSVFTRQRIAQGWNFKF